MSQRVRKAAAESQGSRTYFCYLLRSMHKLYKGSTYIGFTVHPERRIRQHNGEIKNGANKTKSKRPWEIVCTIYGFPSKVAALQFEWAWQNPRKSRLIKAAISSKSFATGAVGKIQILFQMLQIRPWSNFPLHILFLHEDLFQQTVARANRVNSRFVAPPHMDCTLTTLAEFKQAQSTDSADIDSNSESDNSDVEASRLESLEPDGGAQPDELDPDHWADSIHYDNNNNDDFADNHQLDDPNPSLRRKNKKKYAENENESTFPPAPLPPAGQSSSSLSSSHLKPNKPPSPRPHRR